MGSSTVSTHDIQASLAALNDILFLARQNANDEAAVRAYIDMAQSHLGRLDLALKKDAVQGGFKSRWRRLWG